MKTAASTDALIIAFWSALSSESVGLVAVVRWYRLSRPRGLVDLSALGESLVFDLDKLSELLVNGPHQLHVHLGYSNLADDIDRVDLERMFPRGFDLRADVDKMLDVHASFDLDDVRIAYGLPTWRHNHGFPTIADLRKALDAGHVWTAVFALRDDVQVLARLTKAASQASVLTLNTVKEYDADMEPVGRAAQYRSTSIRHPESPDETDANGLFRFHFPLPLWNLLREVADAS